MEQENKTEMPDLIWAFKFGDEHDWNGRKIEDATSYTRTDTIPKITILRQREDGYWEALSDGSDRFRVWDERIEEEYLDKHPDHNDMVPEAHVPTPAGEWAHIGIDNNVNDEKQSLEEDGYQVFMIPRAQSKAEVAQNFVDEVLSHPHFSPMQEVLNGWKRKDDVSEEKVMPKELWVTDTLVAYEFPEDGDEIRYVREDTIPNKVEVARAMFNEAEDRYETGNYLSMSDAIEAVIKEWEDAESK